MNHGTACPHVQASSRLETILANCCARAGPAASHAADADFTGHQRRRGVERCRGDHCRECEPVPDLRVNEEGILSLLPKTCLFCTNPSTIEYPGGFHSSPGQGSRPEPRPMKTLRTPVSQQFHPGSHRVPGLYRKTYWFFACSRGDTPPAGRQGRSG